MREGLVIGFAIVFGLVVGSLLVRRRSSFRLGLLSRVGAYALGELLGAAALGWIATGLFETGGLWRIGTAVFFCVLALCVVAKVAVLPRGLVIDVAARREGPS